MTNKDDNFNIKSRDYDQVSEDLDQQGTPEPQRKGKGQDASGDAQRSSNSRITNTGSKKKTPKT